MLGVVIIVPSQGAHVDNFTASAQAVNQKVYHGRATIVRTTVTKSGDFFDVAFATLGGTPFLWRNVNDGALSTVLTISHAAKNDGPNLALADRTLETFGHQPWGSVDGKGLKLTEIATSFWNGTGRTLSNTGKIILLGCDMGAGNYSSLVMNASGRRTIASTDVIGAGNTEVAQKYVRGIESNHILPPMQAASGTPPKRPAGDYAINGGFEVGQNVGDGPLRAVGR
jgi:hypothetical protein